MDYGYVRTRMVLHLLASLHLFVYLVTVYIGYTQGVLWSELSLRLDWTTRATSPVPRLSLRHDFVTWRSCEGGTRRRKE
jgi:hypothetical protein